MKKIKIVTYENFPFGGAPANFLRNFSFALSKVAEIEVILPTGNVYRNAELKPEKKGKIKEVSYIHLGFTVHPQKKIGKILDVLWGFTFTPIYLFFSNLFKPFNTIILYNSLITQIFNLLLFKKIFKKKLIVILPEFYEKPTKGLLALIHWYDFYYGLKFLAKHADAFIPFSNFLKHYLETELKIKKPVYILPNLLDPDVFVVNDAMEFIPNKITIGYTGTPTKKDGVIDLIQSFSILNKIYPDTHLLIIGDTIGGESEIPKLEKLSIELGCRKHITFTGLVSFEKIPVLINSCQILALTRPNGIFAEAGFPTKLGEYFACKKPVLITEVGDIPLYLTNEEHAIIVKPEDIESIVKGFQKIIENKELSNKIAENGFNWMNENLNYKNVSEKLHDFILSIS
jgi:glycosyltransferase involved in cell wall biosynthesis